MKTNLKIILLPTSTELKSNIKLALILTPAIFLLAFWVMVLSSSGTLEAAGLPKMILWALLLSFGAAYSITLFVNEILKQQGK